ncbi:hypothetical protein Cni_G27839 [Canna indica]|uniref:N-acetyltransferase domain-containing protein n=1 Tax=Canna indica TaxID=4628 RepID=A0AAQ3L4K3_9LILI|nr:hypothetical protein Cni_G27839 [Canna indica]
MALLYSTAANLPVRRPLPLPSPICLVPQRLIFPYPKRNPSLYTTREELCAFPFLLTSQICPSPGTRGLAAFSLCEQDSLALDLDSLVVKECESDDELLAAVRLRVRTFYDEFDQSSGSEDQRRYMEEREFEALKNRIDGKRIGFKRVSCINVTLPLLPLLDHAEELCSTCKFSENGEVRVVVATLDINQCLKMADELTGKRPEAPGAGLLRAYLSNVCVAVELQRNGLGYAIVAKSKVVAHSWGINDLYVHVAVDNEAAKRLYSKSGFIYENEEPTWQARFLGRPRRYLLWADLSRVPSKV